MTPNAVEKLNAPAIRQRYAVPPIAQPFDVRSTREGQTVKLKKILHVDDSFDMREIAKIALATVGNFDLMQCSDGAEAIAAASTFKPDLLLLDVMMPTLSGPEVYTQVQALPGFENIPVIFLTVKAQDSFAAQLREQGAIGVISKPFDPMHLAEEVSALWQAAQNKTSH